MSAEHYTPEQVCDEVLQQIGNSARSKRKELLKAHLQSTYGRRMTKAKIEQRLDLILKYRNAGPLWIRKNDSKEVVRVKKCLDFAYPGLLMRCLGKDDDLLVFDPDRVTVETDIERSCRVAEQTLENANRELQMLHETLRNTKAYAESLEQKIEILGTKLDKSKACLVHTRAGVQQWNQSKWFPIAP